MITAIKEKKNSDPNVINFQVALSINAVRLALNDDGNCIAIATLSDSFAQVKVKSDSTSIEGHLGALKIQDMRTEKYTHVVAIKGQHMVDFAFTIKPDSEFTPSYDSISFLCTLLY